MRKILIITFLIINFIGCTAPKKGPDRQGEGLLTGAVYGAGMGAVTGAQLASATGPGALVGAGFGAIAGSLTGIAQDNLEDELIKLAEETRQEREAAFAHEVLADHYQRRGELHPTRDIFPADLFFKGDDTKLRPTAMPLVRELVRIHADKLGWSRLAVASYVQSTSPDKSLYGKQLSEKRAITLGNAFVRAGMEPRRIEARGVMTSAPILIDPLDDPNRYSAAIELILLDLS
jgi:outer membrane protein OmpA-like peptidoglycan-associated protein